MVMLKYALRGELAQLVERQDRTLEVSGSIPLFSTPPVSTVY